MGGSKSVLIWSRTPLYLNAFAKAGRPDKAEALSDEMYSAFMVNGDTELKPSIPMFTTILDAYMRTISDENTIKDKHSHSVA